MKLHSFLKELAKLLKSKICVSFVLVLCHGVVVITTAELHSTKPELILCAGSNPTSGISQICDDEDL